MISPVLIMDVAKTAGVAKSTVSRVLNGRGNSSRICPDTQKRILAIVRQLGYQANPAARHVALGNPPFYFAERLAAMAVPQQADSEAQVQAAEPTLIPTPETVVEPTSVSETFENPTTQQPDTSTTEVPPESTPVLEAPTPPDPVSVVLPEAPPFQTAFEPEPVFIPAVETPTPALETSSTPDPVSVVIPAEPPIQSPILPEPVSQPVLTPGPPPDTDVAPEPDITPASIPEPATPPEAPVIVSPAPPPPDVAPAPISQTEPVLGSDSIVPAKLDAELESPWAVPLGTAATTTEMPASAPDEPALQPEPEPIPVSEAPSSPNTEVGPN